MNLHLPVKQKDGQTGAEHNSRLNIIKSFLAINWPHKRNLGQVSEWHNHGGDIFSEAEIISHHSFVVETAQLPLLWPAQEQHTPAPALSTGKSQLPKQIHILIHCELFLCQTVKQHSKPLHVRKPSHYRPPNHLNILHNLSTQPQHDSEGADTWLMHFSNQMALLYRNTAKMAATSCALFDKETCQ